MKFSPDHYYEAIEAGADYQQMLDNIEVHARRLAENFFAYINGGSIIDAARLYKEAETIRNYRREFVDWLLDSVLTEGDGK